MSFGPFHARVRARVSFSFEGSTVRAFARVSRFILGFSHSCGKLDVAMNSIDDRCQGRIRRVRRRAFLVPGNAKKSEKGQRNAHGRRIAHLRRTCERTSYILMAANARMASRSIGAEHSVRSSCCTVRSAISGNGWSPSCTHNFCSIGQISSRNSAKGKAPMSFGRLCTAPNSPKLRKNTGGCNTLTGKVSHLASQTSEQRPE